MTTFALRGPDRLPCRFHLTDQGHEVPLPLTRPPRSTTLWDLVGSRDCLEVILLRRSLTPLSRAALRDVAVMLENEIFLRAATEYPESTPS